LERLEKNKKARDDFIGREEKADRGELGKEDKKPRRMQPWRRKGGRKRRRVCLW
jgi:hypothetical protein